MGRARSGAGGAEPGTGQRPRADADEGEAVRGRVRGGHPVGQHGHALAAGHHLDHQVGHHRHGGDPGRPGPDGDRQRHRRDPLLVVEVVEDEVGAVEVTGGQVRARGPRVAGGHHRHHLVLEQPGQRHPVHLQVRLGDQRDVDEVGEKGRDRRVVGNGLDAHVDVRRALAEGAEHRRQPREGRAALRGEPDPPVAPVTDLAQVPGRRVQFAEDVAGRDQQSAARGVGDQAAALAVEEGHAQAGLQPGEPLAEGGLAHVEPLGGRGQRAGLGGGGQELQVTQVHIHNQGLSHAPIFVVVL